MFLSEKMKFRQAYNVRRCEKCCGNCKYFDRDYEDSGCAHPKQSEFDSFAKMVQESDPEYREPYGIAGGIRVDEGNVCDLWEQ